MLSWHWPLIFLLLPLPALIRWLMPARKQALPAIRVPFFDRLISLNQQQQPSLTKRSPLIMVSVIWLCLVTAAAQPNWVGEPTPLPQPRRDLMLAVDLSLSMQKTDMPIRGGYIERITAVKAVVGEFVERRVGDRIGLILFAQQSYLQTPLTFDTRTVNQQLQEALLGFAGNATAIGDAIGLAIKKLRDRPAESRVLILLTDGANTAGTDPRQAAKVAAEANIKIHTIGIGSTQRSRRGTELDETTLKHIAQTTGGHYFRARDPIELQHIYAELDQLEPVPEQQTFRPLRSLVHWPLSIALILTVLMALRSIWHHHKQH